MAIPSISTDPSHTDDVRKAAGWIQRRLIFSSSKERINSAIERLVSLDILRETPEGRLIRVDHFIQSKSDVVDRALQEYHKALSDLAKTAVEEQPVLEREFQGMSLNFDKRRLPEAKKAIRNFVAQFTAEFDRSTGEMSEVYHLNTQFFAVTNQGEGK